MRPLALAHEVVQNVGVLRCGGREYCFGPGRYSIGRAPASDIVVSSPLVSRQHARLIVGTHSVVIEDLGSANGLTVNTRRVRSSFTLVPGDRIGVGGHEIQFLEFGVAPDIDCTLVGDGAPLVPHPASAAPVESGTYPRSHDGSAEHDGFALVGAMAERALANRRISDAVDILRYRLTKVLEEAKRGQAITPRTREACIDYACKLASATCDGRWVEYVLELLTCHSVPCPERLAGPLQVAAQAVTGFDRELLDRYARCLRNLPSSIERIRTIQQAERLTEVWQQKRR
jgi:hypothetical protein